MSLTYFIHDLNRDKMSTVLTDSVIDQVSVYQLFSMYLCLTLVGLRTSVRDSTKRDDKGSIP